MRENLKNLKQKISLLPDYHQRMKALENSFEGETCYIVSCGPSIMDVDHDVLRSELSNNLVFSVKQAYFLFKDLVDFHFFNCNNFTPYEFGGETIYCSQADALPESAARAYIWGNQKYDLNFVLRDNKIHENKLSRSKEYDKWCFKNRLDRPWGPSIMHETIIYMAVHLGVSKIRTIGWDHIDPNGKEYKIDHFYDNKQDYKIYSQANPLDVGEIEESIQMSGEVSQWLLEKNIRLEVYDSDKCFIHEDVHRYRI